MNRIAAYIGGFEVYWSSVIITLGILGCLAMTLALYKPRNKSTAAVWIFFPLAFVFSFLFSRILHYYFNEESYKSFFSAMTDYSTGSFVLPGMLLGIWLAASIVRRMQLVPTVGKLLDFATPGILLLIAFIRLSALFNDSCRSKIIINIRLFQRLPFATGSVDTAGNTTYRLATFFIEFLLLMILVLWSLKVFFRSRDTRLRKGCSRNGNVMRLFLVAYGALEIVMDSTRYDSPLMHFRFLSSLNQYSAFIRLAQIFAAVSAICVLVFYSRASIRSAGFSWKHPVLWVLFLASLFGIGYLGEYRVQRYGTQKYFECYGIMALSCLLMFLCVYFTYRMCVIKEREYE